MEFIKWCISCIASIVGLSLIVGGGIAVVLFGSVVGIMLLVVVVVAVVAAGFKESIEEHLANWHNNRHR